MTNWIENNMETKEIIERVFTADKYEIEVITNFGEYSATEFRYNAERGINDFGMKEVPMDGMFKCDETTFSILTEKMINPKEYRDIIADIHCGEERELTDDERKEYGIETVAEYFERLKKEK